MKAFFLKTLILEKIKHFIFGFLVFCVLCFYCGCSGPKKAAKLYTKQMDSLCLLISPPSSFFKSNLKVNEIENFDSFDPEVQDSIIQSNTLFLQNVNDSIFQNNFYREVVFQMKSLGYRVYTPSQILEFLSCPSKSKFSIEMVQMELDEFSEWTNVDYDLVPSSSQQDFILNGATLNVWLKETYPDGDTSKQILFSNYSIRDKVKGHVLYNDGDLMYVMRSKARISQALVDSLWFPTAKQLSQYLSNYYLNNFVSKQFIGETQLPYYSFDVSKRKIKKWRKGKFILM